jgi:hypothetical protein
LDGGIAIGLIAKRIFMMMNGNDYDETAKIAVILHIMNSNPSFDLYQLANKSTSQKSFEEWQD